MSPSTTSYPARSVRCYRLDVVSRGRNVPPPLGPSEDESAWLQRAERVLEHTFSRPELLREALTHRSYRNEHPRWPARDNERLEFLGDAVLDAVVSRMLMDAFPAADEGELTRRRAALVRTEALAEQAGRLRLVDVALLGRGERRSRGAHPPRLLAGLFEACVGAIYLDGGEAAAARFAERTVGRELAQESDLDPKSRLQQLVQRRYEGTLPHYELVEERGPHHARRFEVVVRVGRREAGRGEGASKAAAERAAAAAALRNLFTQEQ